MKVQGYARVTTAGKVLLAFADGAPIFDHAPNSPTVPLYEADDDDEVVGYSVIVKGETHGFLWYPHEKEHAEKEAADFTVIFSQEYVCIPLTY